MLGICPGISRRTPNINKFWGSQAAQHKKLLGSEGVRERGSNLANSPDIIYVYGLFSFPTNLRRSLEGLKISKLVPS